MRSVAAGVAAFVVAFVAWFLVVMGLTIALLKLHHDVETARTRQVETLEAEPAAAKPDVSSLKAEIRAKHSEFITVSILLITALALGLFVFTIQAHRLAAAARDAREVLEFRPRSPTAMGLDLDDEDGEPTGRAATPAREDAAAQPAQPDQLEPDAFEQDGASASDAEDETAAPEREPTTQRPPALIRSSVTLPPRAEAAERTALDDVLDSLAPPDTDRRRHFDLLRHAGLRFPALADELGRLLEAVEQPRTYMHQLVREIPRYPELAHRLIRFANTLYFSPPKPARGLNLALVVLGADGLLSGAIAQGVHDVFDFSRSVQVELWHESIAVAVAAALVGRVVRHAKPGALHSLGLASRLGRMVLLHNRPEEYARLVDLQVSERVAAHDVEQEAFGFTGAQVGAVALAVWRLPVWMQGAVMYADDLDAPGLQRFGHEAVVAAAVLDAAGAVSRAALNATPRARAAAGALATRGSVKQLGLTQDQLDDVAQDLRDMVEEQRSFL